jgi:hypothetical protein
MAGGPALKLLLFRRFYFEPFSTDAEKKYNAERSRKRKQEIPTRIQIQCTFLSGMLETTAEFARQRIRK